MKEKFDKFLKRHRACRRYYRAVREQEQPELFEPELHAAGRVRTLEKPGYYQPIGGRS